MWALASHVGDLNGVSGYGLWSGPDLAVLALWGVSQQMKISFSFSPSATLPFKFKKIKKKLIPLSKRCVVLRTD